MDIEQARFNMIEQQIRPWDVLNTDVLDVMQSVPRELFVPKQYENLAFSDVEIPLDHDQVMMSPKVEGRMLQALKISPHDQVLEIGTGSGYITACLAQLAHQVTSLELHAEFSTAAKKCIAQLNLDKKVEFIVGNLFTQANALGTYDVIAITGSIPQYVTSLNKLLRPNGRLFVIVGEAPAMSAELITCVQESQYRSEALFETCIPALLDSTKETVFEF